MTRDFSQENLGKINELFEKTSSEENDDIADEAKQLRSTYGKVLSQIGGYPLLSSIIQDNLDLSRLKRTSKSKLTTIFNDVSVLDIPYGDDTYSALKSLQESIASLCTVFEQNSNSLKTIKTRGAIKNLFDHKKVEKNLKAIKKQLDDNLDNLYKISVDEITLTITTLSEAANTDNSYDTFKDSKDPIIQKALKLIDTNKLDQIEDPEIKNFIFAKACYTAAIIAANEYGQKATTTIDYDSTKNTFEYLRYSNHTTTTETRIMINNNRTEQFPSGIIARKKDDPICAGYIYNAITLKKTGLPLSPLGRYLYNEHSKDNAVGSTTTPQFAALSGGINRSKNGPKNNGLLAPTVKAVISISNNEDITIKIPGSKDYITLEGSSKFNYSEQWDIVKDSKAVKANDILFIGNGEYDRYIDMYHVVAMDSPETYSGQNGAVVNGSVYDNYIKKQTEQENNNRLYIVLLNSDESAIQEMNNQYP